MVKKTESRKIPSHDLLTKAKELDDEATAKDEDVIEESRESNDEADDKTDKSKDADDEKDKSKDANPKKEEEKEPPKVPKEEDDDDIIEVEEASPDDLPENNEDSVQPPTLPPTNRPWNDMLYTLLLYKARWGDMNVPPGDEEHAELYGWVVEQRNQYKMYQELGEEGDEAEVCQNALTPDRISVLDTIGFAWNIRGDVFWQKHYDALVAYKKEHGDVKVPRLYPKNPKLGEWVTDQRRQLKAKNDGRPSMMTDERKVKLDSLGFLWKVRERADWNDRYEQLLEYKKENGHCVVPQHYAQNRALGKWVAKQREQYRFYHEGKHSFLTEERIDLLKSLGFVWRVKGKGKEDFNIDSIDTEDEADDALKAEEESESDAPRKKKRKKKLPNKKAAAKNMDKNEQNSDIDDDDDDEIVSNAKAKEETNEPAAAATVPSMNNMGLFASMNGMGMLTSSVADGTPGGLPSLPSLPPDQQLYIAEQQHMARASMLDNFAARANQQLDFARQRAIANSTTMADIAAALARQSRFGNGFAAPPGMGMFGNMNMRAGYPAGMQGGLPGSGEGNDSEENLQMNQMI